MLTLRSAAGLLGAASSIEGGLRLLGALGFSRRPIALDGPSADALGAGSPLGEVTLLEGDGALRCLLFLYPAGASGRDLLVRLAQRLQARSAHVAWLVVGIERDGRGVLIAAPHRGPRTVRVAALMVDRSRILDSDADAVRMLAAAHSDDDIGTHARFVEILGRDALSRRFFRTLQASVHRIGASGRHGDAAAREEIALLYASRLLFLAFLECKAWLASDLSFLAHLFDDCMLHGGQFHTRVLLPLFFGTLNTPASRRAPVARRFGSIPFLNGGLFTPTPLERMHRPLRFSDEALGGFFGDLLSRYRFTAREETASFEEASIDPEMLGRTFECLMSAGVRQSSGAFYTPHPIVERVPRRA